MVRSEQVAARSVSYGNDIARNDVATMACWQSAAVLQEQQVKGPLLTVLRARGSLTASLQAGAGDEFSVRVLRQESCRTASFPDHALPPGHGEGLLREVYLCCSDRVAVFAQTVMPATTLATHPWLGELGEEPLGRRLFARDDVVREPFQYALLDPSSSLAMKARAGLGEGHADGSGLWARRSLFLVGEQPVSVNEVFFPAVISCLV